MKKSTLLITSLLVGFVFTSCASSKKAEAQPENTPVESQSLQIKPAVNAVDFDMQSTGNHSYLTEEDIGKTVVIKGTLQKGSVNYFIKENASSRSAVTISIVGTESADADLAALIGKTVSITGKLTASQSPWNKEIQYISFEVR